MPKYNVRRKAQLGLDIREGGIAIPIANNMFYIDGRKHAAGGVAIGPNNKNGVEVEGGEVVEMIDSKHPSVGRQFKAGGQQQTMRVFSSVPFLRGVSPAQLVMNGANPDTVFKAQEEFKDRNRINDDGTTYENGGKIAIEGAKTIGGYLPFVGTALDAYELYKNPSWKQAGWTTLGLLTDIFTGGSARAVVKTARNLKNAKEALSIVRGPITKRLYKDAAVDAIKANTKAKKDVIRDATFNVGQNYVQHITNKYELGGEKNISINNLPSSFRGRKIGDSYYQIGIPPSTNKIKSGVTGFKNYLKGLNNDLDEFGVTFTQVSKKVMPKPLRDTYAKIVNAFYKTNKIDKINTAANQIGTASMATDKKKFGGNMIYSINGNVKNGLVHYRDRPKARYGTINKKDKDVKVGQDGLIYKRAADGEWYTDGTVHVAFKKATPGGVIKSNSNSAKKFNYVAPEPKRVYIEHSDYEEEKETKKIGSLTYEKNESGKWVPSAKQSTTTTRDGGRPKDFGMTRTGVNHPNGNYKYHPLTGEKISEIGIVETSEPSVKSTTRVTSKSSSTPRGRVTKTSTPKATKSTPTIQDTVNKITMDAWKASKSPKIDLSNAKMPIFDISQLGSKETKEVKTKLNTPSTGDGTKSKDGRWIGQYKTTNIGDWIGLGSNLAGSVASYFMTKNAINKMPEPIKPVMTQPTKLKTRYNVEPQLTEIREAEQMNRAAVRRNTQSSNTSLAREQRLMNEARGARNTLYGQKENIETQLINQDRLNRQSVMRDNVRAYNDYLNRLTATKMAQNEMRASNINNLISGLTGSVSNILGTIESRRATNNTLRAIAAANPNVDARLIGGFDYYIDPITKKKYNKNQQYVGTING